MTNPSAAFYGVGGAKHHLAGRRHREARRARAHQLPRGVTEQGQGAESVIAQVAATAFGVPHRQRARDHRRHRQHALWRRHLGLARRRHRRRSGLAGRQGAARQRARRRRRHAAGEARDARHPRRHGGRRGQRRRAPAARRARARRLFPPRHAAGRRAGRAGGDAPLRAARLSVRLHQRRAGELSRSRYRHRLRQAAEALVRRGLRHHHQPAAGRRADARRRGAGHRRRAVRALPL